MRKITLINIVSLLVLYSAGTSLAAPADRFAAVSIQTIPVAEGVYMLVGSGGNIGVSVGDDGVLIIDSQYAPLSKKIRAAVAALNSSKPAFILNTHFHGDHVGGNVNFGADGLIIAHENVRGRMVGGESAKVALPIVTYGDSISVYFNGEEIRLKHMPTGTALSNSPVPTSCTWVITCSKARSPLLTYPAAARYRDIL
ncbi:MAG: MBL fold metallo-hydrolase [Pseudomonadales bacterium]|jgi:glyoxylase-like metal-dependent hydrolase (beta-lactamase superfamily II)|nr:MBL fold metallo-hydrolase [Pseudomonadales bacterium]HJN51852.1 MBL fold metallo-hydrolase [Pseudomonadales bacterium]|tara:strand:+ start:1559 stop:2152 length:594 start_codon:yes stop_codon:yes gene_type:complete